MKQKDKLNWRTRLRLCWVVLTKGEYDPEDYKTKKQEAQWQICEQRRKELEATIRPRTETGRRYYD